jgi:integrase
LPVAKTKSKRDRAIPISIKPVVREILTRRQTGTTQGPNPQTFTFGPDHFVFGNKAGRRITSIKTAWESAVLRGHGEKVERTRGRLSAENRAKLTEIDLNFHDLRHECASRLYFDEGWTICGVSLLLGHADAKTTARYIGADQKNRLHDLVAKRALKLVK